MDKSSLVVTSFLLIASSFVCASINYGDFQANTLWFMDVGENDNGYFGAPVIVGDSILFSPQNFEAQASNGSSDNATGQVWMTFDAKAGRDIDSIEIEEYGDWSLFGVGTVGTYASVYGLGTIQIVEVENVALVTPVSVQALMLYKKTNVLFWDDGVFNLVDDGPGAEQWEGELKFDVDQILLDAGILGKATKINFTMDNILNAVSETGTVAQIEKKDIGGFVVTVPQVPEPASMLLLAMGGFMLRKRK